VPPSKLDCAIVPDIAQPDTFSRAVITDPQFEAVIHIASPFHFNVTDTKKDFLTPAVNGTTGLLRAIKKHAPTVKRVVLTSSFAAMIDTKDWKGAGKMYSEVTTPSPTPRFKKKWQHLTHQKMQISIPSPRPKQR
jgi:nucleoside-diphosphate-sugar epimerase